MVACHRGHCLWFAGDGIEIEGWTLRPTAFKVAKAVAFLEWIGVSRCISFVLW